jgi:hypothetical protein
MYTLGNYYKALCTLRTGTHKVQVELERVETGDGDTHLVIRGSRGGPAVAALVLDAGGNLILFQPPHREVQP